MQESLFSSTVTRKLYNERAVMVATLIGGPLVAGYLLAENYKALDQKEKVNRTWLFTIICFIIILIIAYVTPGKVPSFLFPIAYSAFAQFLAQRFQGNQIKIHTENGGGIYNIWRSVWIGAISAIILFVIVFGVLVLIDSMMKN
jgi:hypothetical protein